ncbi:hypothetical protein DFR29_109126 [Tahibacter aquaticus]|uniref:Uncharacterized protein n=1 Tax=Tahibacter aquaticus TaxID=520092 RepID=A0A4R6YU66_9GAMM|nr:hypothetical protein [Tahibacter aquaticus]TDR42070.1 hypothetical protein DFR29_109126 [Tahibacter aquaticus]
MSVKSVRCLVAGLLLSYLGGALAANAAPTCGAGDGPAMELRVLAAALAADSDRSLVVSVFDDGCVQLHRPAYRRDAGDFRLQLAPAALDTLRRTVDHPALRTFDAKRVKADIAAAQRKYVGADGRAERYSELDADRYEIHWRSAGKRGVAAWTGLPGPAQTYSDNESLQAFHKAASALQALAERSDAVRLDGGRP